MVFALHLDEHGVQIEDGIDGSQGSILPGLDLGPYLVGDGADGCGGNIDAVDVASRFCISRVDIPLQYKANTFSSISFVFRP